MEALMSFSDTSNTDFGKVMEVLGRVTEELPDFIVVLSDMEFDRGSAVKKDAAMKILRKRNPNLRIVWWKFRGSDATPETDEYGNVFMGGYNANLLKF